MHRTIDVKHPMNVAACPAFAPVDGQRLRQSDRDRVWAHLMTLSPSDRQSRFGYAISDDALARWVDSWDWEAQWLWHPHGPSDPVVALLQLAPVGDGRWEMGLSVSPIARGQGWGRVLRDQGLQWARRQRNAGQFGEVILHGSSYNRALVRLCQGSLLTMEQGEITARFQWASDHAASTSSSNCLTGQRLEVA